MLFSSKFWYNYHKSRYCHPKQEALAPVHPSSPVKRVKICGILAANKRQNISAEPVYSSEHSVQNFIRVAYSCRAVFVFIR